MFELSFNGLKDGGTFMVGETMTRAVKDNLDLGIGKVVSLTSTSSYTVDYGSDGDPIFGVVEKVEHAGDDADTLVATVLWQRTFVDIACAGTEQAGDPLVCDGSGGVKKLESLADGATRIGAFALGAGTGNKVAIRVL